MANGVSAESVRAGRNTIQLPGDLQEEVQRFRMAQAIPPTEAATVRVLIRAGLKALRDECQEA